MGVPGLAKTLLINTVARVVDLKFFEDQFTPDSALGHYRDRPRTRTQTGHRRTGVSTRARLRQHCVGR